MTPLERALRRAKVALENTPDEGEAGEAEEAVEEALRILQEAKLAGFVVVDKEYLHPTTVVDLPELAQLANNRIFNADLEREARAGAMRRMGVDIFVAHVLLFPIRVYRVRPEVEEKDL